MDKSLMLISFSNELAKEINPSFWALPKIGNSFLFFWCKPKKKKLLILLRVLTV